MFLFFLEERERCLGVFFSFFVFLRGNKVEEGRNLGLYGEVGGKGLVNENDVCRT